MAGSFHWVRIGSGVLRAGEVQVKRPLSSNGDWWPPEPLDSQECGPARGSSFPSHSHPPARQASGMAQREAAAEADAWEGFSRPPLPPILVVGCRGLES